MVKFSEMPYTRPSISEVQAAGERICAQIQNAACAQEQIDAYSAYEKLFSSVETMLTIAYIRHSVDTRDAFYDAENEFADESMPLLQQIAQSIDLAMLHSKFRAELESHYGKLMFTNLEISVRSFKPEITELMQEENKLASQYQKLYASAVVEFDGQKMPLPKLGPYKLSPDRDVRRRAFEAEGKFFDENQAELDELYTKLVRCRNAQARKLGHENYIQLGYDRLGRNCYGPEQVRAFRDQIANDMTPIVAEVKKAQAKRIGVDKLYYYDDNVMFPDGNAAPKGTPDEILAAGKRMYHELSPETAEFIDAMFEGELFDVLSKEGKAPGGYCTGLPDYHVPFIFSNFNATAGDVDVLTHEAGHAFADFRAYKYNYPMLLKSPNMESCECHSMSMEFLTQDYHKYFFGEDTEKYAYYHCADSLMFVPYGCMVDEFQHLMYENEDMTPEERNQTWLKLEEKYRPWIDFDKLPFYGRGAGWQRQLHIYLHPLYYIDYCMAQTVAFQFWIASMHDRKDAWERYLRFVDAGGTKTFEQLCHDSGLRVPYEAGCIREVGSAISAWLSENNI